MSQLIPLRRVPIHRSLIRPILLGGAETALVQINGTCILGLLFGVGFNKLTLIASLFLAITGQFILRTLGKHDPQMSRVYIRHIHYRSFYSARGSRLARTPLVRPSITIR
jgi:type IV secretory pathway TrbD component